jgi:hypothetical protein
MPIFLPLYAAIFVERGRLERDSLERGSWSGEVEQERLQESFAQKLREQKNGSREARTKEA